MLVDTHCHIHSSDYQLDPEQVISNALKDGVNKFVCVGTDLEDSQRAVEFAEAHDGCWSAIGVHPHHADNSLEQFGGLTNLLKSSEKIVAVGECGLDYHYLYSSKNAQKQLFKQHLELGLEYDLPFIFHVRNAFDDFFEIIDEYKGIRGVVHSFTAGEKELSGVLLRNLYIGINGIATFTKDKNQLEAIKEIPADRLLFETDAPFLTPVPKRGNVNEPKFMRLTVEFIARLRGKSEVEIAKSSSQNAKNLFSI